MSTITPAKAAQLLLVFFTVIVIVNPMPVLSSRISDLTRDEGVMVGNGPAVSVGAITQVPEELPLPELVLELLLETISLFLQASINNGTDVAPINKFFKNFFLVCSIMRSCWSKKLFR